MLDTVLLLILHNFQNSGLSSLSLLVELREGDRVYLMQETGARSITRVSFCVSLISLNGGEGNEIRNIDPPRRNVFPQIDII